jgi:hypothetical protein
MTILRCHKRIIKSFLPQVAKEKYERNNINARTAAIAQRDQGAPRWALAETKSGAHCCAPP